MKKIITKAIIGIKKLIKQLFFGFIIAIAVMILWNKVIPYIFELPTLDISKAYTLTLLCSILFNLSLKDF